MGWFEPSDDLEQHASEAVDRPGGLPRLGHRKRGQGMEAPVDQGMPIEKEKQLFLSWHLATTTEGFLTSGTE